MKRKLLALGIMIAGLTASAQTPRLSLYEEFTGETCGPCASTNPGLNNILLSPTNASKIVAIKWQVPIPSAPTKTWSLYQTNKAEIDARYRAPASGGYGYQSLSGTSASSLGVNSAPQGRIDGQHQTAFGAGSDHPANVSNNVITAAQSHTSAFSITMTRAWNANCTAVTLTVDIAATANFTATGNLVFRTVMVERLIQFSVQPGTNGETKFEDVARKSYPDIQNGTPMQSAWTNGQTQTFTLNCVLPSYINKIEEIAFVGFIQDDGNQKVAQACRADKAKPDHWAVMAGAKVDVTCNNQITPVVYVKNDGLNAITSLTIAPTVDSAPAADFVWNGNVAPGATATITLNPLTTGTTVGSHNFKYNVTALNATPQNITVQSNTVTYLVAGSYQGTPVVESFAAAFPPAKWTNINSNGGIGWTKGDKGAYNLSTSSAKMDFFNNTVIGDKDELYLPPMDLSGINAPELSFDVAHAQRTSTTDDKLEVFLSDDCGVTWTSVFSASGLNLATAAESAVSFTPSSVTDWTNRVIILTGWNKPNVLAKFVATNDNGNSLFVDNVNLSQSAPGYVGLAKNANANFGMSIYPNPANGVTVLNVNSAKASTAKITVMNTIGQVVFDKSADLNAGANTISIDTKNMASGIYYVSVETNNGSTAKKLVVTH